MFNSKLTLAKLQEKATSIVDVFSKTMQELKEVNTHILNKSNENVAKITELNQENTALEELKLKNNKVIANIEKIFE